MHIDAPHGHLEARFRAAEGPVRGAAVVCHPHPLHGGNMHTKAVFRTAQALSEAGFHTLRFNFRGVGASTGSYGEGVDEMEDVRAALDWVSAEHPDLPILLAGFSFGSLVALRTGLGDARVAALLGFGVPVRLYDFGFLEEPEKPVHLIQGEADEFGGGEELQEIVEGLAGAVTLTRIPDSGHFFHDHFDALKAEVVRWVTEGDAAAHFRPLPTGAEKG